MPTFEFTSSDGNRVSVHSEDIVHVARPHGSYAGELTLRTGAKWGFGGDKASEYRRAKAMFELAHEEARNGEN